MTAAAKIVPIQNPLAEYKAVTEEMKALEARKNFLRKDIFAFMDGARSDEVAFGDLKARRTLVVQERLDSKRLKEAMGPQYQAFVSEVPVIRLSVI